MPRYSVSNSDMAPRITGSPSSFTRAVIETNGFSRMPSDPSGCRTATAIFEGERIITPSITAWPPTGRNGIGSSTVQNASVPRLHPGRGTEKAASSRTEDIPERRPLRDRLRPCGRGLVLLVAPAEALDASRLVDDALLAGKERVAVGADVQVHLAVGRGGSERSASLPLRPAAVAMEGAQLVNGMN